MLSMNAVPENISNVFQQDDDFERNGVKLMIIQIVWRKQFACRLVDSL